MTKPKATRVIHTRVEKVREDLSWQACRLAPPIPPSREETPQITHGANLQAIANRKTYEEQYLQYVTLYETYLGHLRRLRLVYDKLQGAVVSLKTESPTIDSPLPAPAAHTFNMGGYQHNPAPARDALSPSTHPGFGLEFTYVPNKQKLDTEAKKDRRRAARRRQRAARKARKIASDLHATVAKTELAKAELGWTRVATKQERAKERAAKAAAKRAEAKTQAPKLPPPVISVPTVADPPARPNRSARRLATYGPPRPTEGSQ